MSDVLNAKTAPKLDFVLAFQETCGATAAEAGLAVEPALLDPTIARQLWESQDVQLRMLRRNPLLRRKLYSLPPAPTNLAGRDIELSWLDQQQLTSDNDLRLATIDGMPGVGKTALVTAWVYARPYVYADGVYFIDLQGASPTGVLDPSVALRRILTGLGASLDHTVDMAYLIDRFRTITVERDMCVVLDNASDEAQVRPLIPSRGGCIVTSRRRLTGLGVREGARQMTVHPLSTTHGSGLLRTLTDRSADETSEVAKICGGLPLGLRLAAELLTSGRATAADLVHARRSGVSAALDHATDDPASQLHFLFNEAFSTRIDPERRLLALFADSPCPDLSTDAIASLVDSNLTEAEELVGGLADANLLLVDSTGRATMHDLVRSWIRANRIELDSDAARQRLFEFYLAAADTMDRALLPARNRPQRSARYTPPSLPSVATYDHWLEWGLRELDNMVAVVSDAVATGDWATAAELPHVLMSLLNIAKPWPQWISMYETVAQALDNLDATASANILNSLGIAYRETAQWKNAIDVLRRADDAYAECGNNTGRAMALSNLALCQRSLEDNEESVLTLKRALTVIAKEDDPFRTAIVAQNLAEGELIAGRPEEAVLNAKAALAAASEVDDTVGVAITLTTIGEIQIALNEPRLAEHAFRQAAAMQEELHDSHALGFTHRRLARLLTDDGRRDEALLHARKAAKLFKELGAELEAESCIELVTRITGS